MYYCVYVYGACFFFFVKHKTAYEMRISDWSLDVCSSDLRLPHMLVLIKRQTLAQFDQIVEYVFEAERIKVGHERRCAERQLGYIFRNIGRLKADTSTTASMVDLAIINNFAT